MDSFISLLSIFFRIYELIPDEEFNDNSAKQYRFIFASLEKSLLFIAILEMFYFTFSKPIYFTNSIFAKDKFLSFTIMIFLIFLYFSFIDNKKLDDEKKRNKENKADCSGICKELEKLSEQCKKLSEQCKKLETKDENSDKKEEKQDKNNSTQ